MADFTVLWSCFDGMCSNGVCLWDMDHLYDRLGIHYNILCCIDIV